MPISISQLQDVPIHEDFIQYTNKFKFLSIIYTVDDNLSFWSYQLNGRKKEM